MILLFLELEVVKLGGGLFLLLSRITQGSKEQKISALLKSVKLKRIIGINTPDFNRATEVYGKLEVSC